MKYHHRFRVKAPLSGVAAFHQQQASLASITPPPIRVELHRIPEPFASGGVMDFTLWFGPLPIHSVKSISPPPVNGSGMRCNSTRMGGGVMRARLACCW